MFPTSSCCFFSHTAGLISSSYVALRIGNGTFVPTAAVAIDVVSSEYGQQKKRWKDDEKIFEFSGAQS